MGKALEGKMFSTEEKKFMVGISFVIGMRQFGMMMVLPFMEVYGSTLTGSTPATIGLALGIYGLTQGIFQIPYGMLGDRIGRKPVILLGLVLQIIGFAAAVYTRDIYAFIFARALQGCGAINSVALSWTGDLMTGKINRAMGIISTVSSGAIGVSLLSGVLMQNILSIPQIFLLCAIISILSLLYIISLKEDRKAISLGTQNKTYYTRALLTTKRLNRMYGIGFIANFLLMAMFYILPQVSGGNRGLWQIFIPAILFVLLAVKVVSRYAARGKAELVQTIISAVLIISVPCWFSSNWLLVSAGAVIFFAGVMGQSTLINAGINTMANSQYRGSVNGVSNTVQVIGSFMGGTLTGFFWGLGLQYCLLMLLVVCILGLGISAPVLKREIVFRES